MEPVDIEHSPEEGPAPQNSASDLAEPQEKPAASPTTGRRGRSKRRWLAIPIVLALILITAGIGAYAWIVTSPDLTALMPADTPIAAQTDLNWWWNATSAFRRLPEVQQALADLNTQDHISFERDILPWAGQVGVAGFSFDDKNPRFAVFLQVRNWFAFARFLSRMSSKISLSPKGGGNGGGSTTTYDGIPIQESTLGEGKGKEIPFDSCMLRNWFVFGFGLGSVERVIDTYTGKTPALSSDPNWQTALNRLHSTPVSWVVFRTDSIASAIPKTVSAQVPAADKFMMVASFSDLGDGMRWDGVVLPTTSQARTTMLQMAANDGAPITSIALKSVPNDAVFTLLGSNPGKSLTALVKQFAGYLPIDDHAKKVLASLTGPAAASVVVSGESKQIGAVAYADADSAADATAAEAQLRSQAGFTEWHPNEPAGPGDSGTLPLQMVAHVTGNRVTFASAPQWIDSPIGSPYLNFPQEANGANSIALGNFRFLPTLQTYLTTNEITKNDHAASFIHDIALDNAQWAIWSRTDSSTAISQSTATITAWDWRQALDSLVNTDLMMRAAHPAARLGAATDGFKIRYWNALQFRPPARSGHG